MWRDPTNKKFETGLADLIRHIGYLWKGDSGTYERFLTSLRHTNSDAFKVLHPQQYEDHALARLVSFFSVHNMLYSCNHRFFIQRRKSKKCCHENDKR